jgi:hypothetical protein
METNSETPTNQIETFDGSSVTLPSGLENFCNQDPELQNNLKTLLYRMQKYLSADEEDKPVSLRHIIYQLRDMAKKYPDLKDVFIDFAIDNSEDTKLNSNLKHTILYDWINYTEQQLREHEQINKNYSNNSLQRSVARHVRAKIDDVFTRINGIIRINPC